MTVLWQLMLHTVCAHYGMIAMMMPRVSAASRSSACRSPA